MLIKTECTKSGYPETSLLLAYHTILSCFYHKFYELVGFVMMHQDTTCQRLKFPGNNTVKLHVAQYDPNNGLFLTLTPYCRK